MDQNKDNFPADDIMLSSAEDLNTDGSFMGGEQPMETQESLETQGFSGAQAVPIEVRESEQRHELEQEYRPDEEYAPGKPQESDRMARYEDVRTPMRDAVRDNFDDIDAMEAALIGAESEEAIQHIQTPAEPVQQPERYMPGDAADNERDSRGKQTDSFPAKKSEVRSSGAKQPEAKVISAKPCRDCGVNKLALVWMIILTIILTGVIGMMVYSFIIKDRSSDDVSVSDETQIAIENVLISGSLEVYLNEVNLDNYSSSITLVNNGGVVTLTGTLKNTVYVNANSALTLVLDGVTIETDSGAALVNITENDLVLRTQGANSLSGTGSTKYPAALYSAGPLAITGNGSLAIYASGAGMAAIKTAKGYRITGSDMYALGQASAELPITGDDEEGVKTQAYFAKNLQNKLSGSVRTTAADEDGSLVASFVSDGFSSLLVSNSLIKDGAEYTITFSDVTAEK